MISFSDKGQELIASVIDFLNCMLGNFFSFFLRVSPLIELGWCGISIVNSEEIFLEDKEVGKLLIKNKNPFALIKLQNDLLNFEKIYQCGNAKVKILKPDWI